MSQIFQNMGHLGSRYNLRESSPIKQGKSSFFLGRFLWDWKNIIQLLSSAAKMHPYHLLHQHEIPWIGKGIWYEEIPFQKAGLLNHQTTNSDVQWWDWINLRDIQVDMGWLSPIHKTSLVNLVRISKVLLGLNKNHIDTDIQKKDIWNGRNTFSKAWCSIFMVTISSSQKNT